MDHKNIYKVRFNSSSSGDQREFVINDGRGTRFQFGPQPWLKLLAGQGKDGKTVFLRYYNYDRTKIELLNFVGAEEFSQLIGLSWPEEISEETIPGFVCPCGKTTDVLYWHPKLSAWFCSYPHGDWKVKRYKKKRPRGVIIMERIMNDAG